MMTSSMENLARTLIDRAGDRTRYLVAIAGPPGAGKSTMADALTLALRSLGETAEVLPMDGFHMDDGILREKGLLPRKGAPETFDVRGFLDIIRAIKSADQDVLVPVFDRSREIAIAAARIISPSIRFVVAEGNYLLLDKAPWSSLEGQFDYAILIAPPTDILEERLMSRWRGYGYSEDEARTKTQENDLKNGVLVRNVHRRVDIILSE